MNNNISLKYTAKKTLGITESLVSLIASLYLGAEYAAYVLGYAISACASVFRTRHASLFVTLVKRYASVCAVTLGAVVFFGVIGGMEAGTIAPAPGFIICLVMFGAAFAGLNSRK